MRIWLQRSGSHAFPNDAFYIVHLKEPKPKDESWQSLAFLRYAFDNTDAEKFGIYNHTMDENEVAEIDLSGKRPRLVCVWERSKG